MFILSRSFYVDYLKRSSADPRRQVPLWHGSYPKWGRQVGPTDPPACHCHPRSSVFHWKNSIQEACKINTCGVPLVCRPLWLAGGEVGMGQMPPLAPSESPSQELGSAREVSLKVFFQRMIQMVLKCNTRHQRDQEEVSRFSLGRFGVASASCFPSVQLPLDGSFCQLILTSLSAYDAFGRIYLLNWIGMS